MNADMNILVQIFIIEMREMHTLVNLVMPNKSTFPFCNHKAAPPFLSQSRKLAGALSPLKHYNDKIG